jgi:hypothetical protein
MERTMVQRTLEVGTITKRSWFYLFYIFEVFCLFFYFHDIIYNLEFFLFFFLKLSLFSHSSSTNVFDEIILAKKRDKISLSF